MPVRVRSGRSANIYFLKNEYGQALTVNSEHYRMIINDFLWLELIYMYLDDM